MAIDQATLDKVTQAETLLVQVLGEVGAMLPADSSARFALQIAQTTIPLAIGSVMTVIEASQQHHAATPPPPAA